MPYPGQITRDSIIQQAHALVEADGADALSLGKLAKALGVKAPSLYRHVGNKDQLLQAVNVRTLEQLFAQINDTLSRQDASDANTKLLAIAKAYRQFALAHAHLYHLFSTSQQGSGRPDEALLVQLILPIETLMSELSGEAKSLTALRGLLAQIHGFILLELNQQLQRGGDLNDVFEETIRAYLRGWS